MFFLLELYVDMYSLLYFVEHKLCSFRLLLMTFAEKTNLLNRRNIFEYLCIMLIMTMFTHDYLVHCYHFIYKEECLWSRLYTDQSICYLFCSSMKDTWTCLTRCRFYTRCARHCIIFVMTFWNVQHSISEQIKVVVIVLTILLFFFH